MGVVPVLIVAGLIEGFISPSALGWRWKFALAGSLAVIFYSYLFFCARGSDTKLELAGAAAAPEN
jgi:hypothetical protein